MESHLIGESAAIVTSVLWTLCSILFTLAGRRLGILSLNAYRTVMALCLLGSAHIILLGTILPAANNSQWLFLAVSGIIGLGIGDFGYFGALVKIGPRKGLLIMSTHPIFALLSAYFILDEVPGFWAFIGIAVTLLGVFIVVIEEDDGKKLGETKVVKKAEERGGKDEEGGGREEMIEEGGEREENAGEEGGREERVEKGVVWEENIEDGGVRKGTIEKGGVREEKIEEAGVRLEGVEMRKRLEHTHLGHHTDRKLFLGITFGFVGAIGQGLGFVLAKYGMSEAGGSGSDLDPLSATLIRMVAACIFIWICVIVTRNLRAVLSKRNEQKALKQAFGGAVFGPFLGVWMSMVAVSYAMAGVAATLMSLMPVIVIPVIWILYGVKTNMRGVLGAFIAVIGVAILFLM